MQRRAAGLGVSGGAILLLLSGCSSDGQCSAQADLRLVLSCAPSVEFAGRGYGELNDKIPARRGALLGEGVYPGCDTEGCFGPPDHDVPTKVWKLKGVDPQDALVARQLGGGSVVVFSRVDAEDLFRLNKDREWVLRR